MEFNFSFSPPRNFFIFALIDIRILFEFGILLLGNLEPVVIEIRLTII